MNNQKVIRNATLGVRNANFDISIYPVKTLLTTNGVQYNAIVTNQTASYVDLFSLDTDTYFPRIKGKLAWVYINISFILWAGTDDPLAKWEIDAKDKDGDWTIMSAVEDVQINGENSEGTALAERLEGYLLLGDNINTAPFSIRLQFRSDSTDANDKVSMRLKNDTIIRLVGQMEV